MNSIISDPFGQYMASHHIRGKMQEGLSNLIEQYIISYNARGAMSDGAWLAQVMSTDCKEVMPAQDAEQFASETMQAMQSASELIHSLIHAGSLGQDARVCLLKKLAELKQTMPPMEYKFFLLALLQELESVSNKIQDDVSSSDDDDDFLSDKFLRSNYQSQSCSSLKAMGFVTGAEGAEIINDSGSETLISGDEISSGLNKTLVSEYKSMSSVKEIGVKEINIYEMNEIAENILANAAHMGAASMTIAAGIYAFRHYQTAKKGNIQANVMLGKSFASGQTVGIKTAIAGALKVGAARNVIPFLSTTASATTISALAIVGLETGRAMHACMHGNMSTLEAADQMGRCSMAGICAMGFSIAGISALTAVLPTAGIVGGIAASLAGNVIGAKSGVKIYDNIKNITRNMHQIILTEVIKNKAPQKMDYSFSPRWLRQKINFYHDAYQIF